MIFDDDISHKLVSFSETTQPLGNKTDAVYRRLTFKWRMDDPEIGRFISVDPLANKYVYNSPYAFSENKVVAHIELEGLEALSFQFEARGVVSGEVAGVTTSQTVGVIVGRSSKADGIHLAGFYTPTLGIAEGQGLTAGLNASYYPTAAIEDLGGFGMAAGYFLTNNPAGVGPVMSGEVNTTGSKGNLKVGGSLGINPASIGVGGGVFAELSYTFLSDLVNVKDLGPDNPIVKELAAKFGVSKEAIIGGVNSMVNELHNQMNDKNRNQTQKEEDKKVKRMRIIKKIKRKSDEFNYNNYIHLFLFGWRFSNFV